ncbi:MAG: nucleotidyltransferase substrate binding protein [Chitinispirillales bacterium]|nr:nucleotidyltransferase substrate binding protein [Chitinispirillales bacterium]
MELRYWKHGVTMVQNGLDITSLKNCVTALEQSIAIFGENTTNSDARMKDVLRSGVIHNFETAYELSWKYMKKWLEANIEPNIATGISRREFYRIAAENQLISNVRDWWDFHEARNRTSHTYNALTAEDVFNAALKFIVTAKEFVTVIEGKI